MLIAGAFHGQQPVSIHSFADSKAVLLELFCKLVCYLCPVVKQSDTYLLYLWRVRGPIVTRGLAPPISTLLQGLPSPAQCSNKHSLPCLSKEFPTAPQWSVSSLSYIVVHFV